MACKHQVSHINLLVTGSYYEPYSLVASDQESWRNLRCPSKICWGKCIVAVCNLRAVTGNPLREEAATSSANGDRLIGNFLSKFFKDVKRLKNLLLRLLNASRAVWTSRIASIKVDAIETVWWSARRTPAELRENAKRTPGGLGWGVLADAQTTRHMNGSLPNNVANYRKQ